MALHSVNAGERLLLIPLGLFRQLIALRLILRLVIGAILILLAIELHLCNQGGNYLPTYGVNLLKHAVLWPEPPQSPKIILFYTPYFSENFTDSLPYRQEAQKELDQCTINNCIFTHDRSAANGADAVVFHIRDLAKTQLPTVRFPSQYYVFYLFESPLHTGWNLTTMEGFFNLTFTYRLDADVPGYDYHRSFQPVPWTNISSEIDFRDLWAQKTGFAVTFMSYCSAPSLRRLYIQEMTLIVPIDTYGSCGNKTCNPLGSKECDGIVKTYKFYLAFENSFCKDYMTEKVYRALNNNVIPVVYGGANYTDLLPPDSFINAFDFRTPQSLAHYLNVVANDTEKYAKYFQWRYDPKSAKLKEHLRPENTSWCRLCKLLNKKDRPQRIISNISRIWNKLTDCASPRVVRDKHDGMVKWLKNPVINSSLHE